MPLVPAGDPLRCGAWAGQCALYIVIMVFEKSVVFLVLLILQWKKVCPLSLLQQLATLTSLPPQPAWKTKYVVSLISLTL